MNWTQKTPRRLGGLISATLIVATLVAPGCASRPDGLEAPYRQFYYNLKTDEERAAYLKLDNSNRQALLKADGLWELWTELPDEEREAAIAGQVELGFHEFTVFMAWGPPADTRGTRDERYDTYLKCTRGRAMNHYVQNRRDCRGAASEVQVVVRDQVVVAIETPKQ